MRTVDDILHTKEKPVNIIEPTAMVIEALQKLIAVNLSYLMVYENGEFIGLFSERDYTRKIVLQGRSSRETIVRDVMTTELPEAGLNDTVEDCMYKMNKRGIRYVAAYDNDKFVGIITIHDILREVLANKQDVFNNDLTNTLLNHEESGSIF